MANPISIRAANRGDEHERYKMPQLVVKTQGRGNGVKTNIVNNVDIAKALDRPPEYVLKYWGCELGTQIHYEAKTGISIINGAHDHDKLSETLEGFINRYVLCYTCTNPETQMKIKKENILLKCKACGEVSAVDPRHKLNTYILKNPPETKKSKEERLKKAAAATTAATTMGSDEEEKEQKEKEQKEEEHTDGKEEHEDGKEAKGKKEKK